MKKIFLMFLGSILLGCSSFYKMSSSSDGELMKTSRKVASSKNDRLMCFPELRIKGGYNAKGHPDMMPNTGKVSPHMGGYHIDLGTYGSRHVRDYVDYNKAGLNAYLDFEFNIFQTNSGMMFKVKSMYYEGVPNKETLQRELPELSDLNVTTSLPRTGDILEIESKISSSPGSSIFLQCHFDEHITYED